SIVSVSLSGNLNVLSPDSDTPCRVIIGIQNSVTGAVLTANRCLYVSSYDGKVRMWNFDSDSVLAIPEPATFGDGSYMTHITAIAGSVENDEVAFGALDDKLHLVGKDQGDFNARTVATDSAPVSIAALGGSTFAVVLENKKAVIIADGQVAQEIEPDHATVIASHPALSLLAIGFDDGTFRIYSVSGASAKPTGVEGQPTQRQVTALAFSPSGEVLATGDAGGKVVPVNTADGTSLTPRWVFHTARITSLSWSPDGAHLASSSLDRHIAVWNKDQLGKVVRIRHTHTEGVGYVAFLSVDSLVSVGYDSGIKTWKLAL
ncbi:WD40 repeat-like protein, partial [Spiromyces aspiralis]